MTSRERIDTNLIRVITLLYSMQDDDINALSQQITQQLTVTYRQTINAQLRLYSCQKAATGPDNKAERWITAKAKSDAASIAKTHNRELRNEVERLYRENPRGNRNFYFSNLERWAQRRNAYKTPSIALNTATAARKYAKDRFREENGIEGRYVLVGPPPVCKKCIRIKGLGPISRAQTLKPNNALPAHINCPHEYEELIPQRIDCQEAWTG